MTFETNNTHINSIRSAANYNPEAESGPQCILWTDKDRLWAKIINSLRKEMPELLVYGGYDPEAFKGPAIWLRVAISRLLKGYGPFWQGSCYLPPWNKSTGFTSSRTMPLTN